MSVGFSLAAQLKRGREMLCLPSSTLCTPPPPPPPRCWHVNGTTAGGVTAQERGSLPV